MKLVPWADVVRLTSATGKPIERFCRHLYIRISFGCQVDALVSRNWRLIKRIGFSKIFCSNKGRIEWDLSRTWLSSAKNVNTCRLAPKPAEPSVKDILHFHERTAPERSGNRRRVSETQHKVAEFLKENWTSPRRFLVCCNWGNSVGCSDSMSSRCPARESTAI